MCLEIKETQRAKIAKEDVICYKILMTENTKGETVLATPFRYVKITLGEKYTSKLVKYTDHATTIEKGLHSCVDIKSAQRIFNNMPRQFNCIIVKTIIPKGSRYFIGKFYSYDDCYASNKIIYTTEIYQK